jgi:hypothetical protein
LTPLELAPAIIPQYRVGLSGLIPPVGQKAVQVAIVPAMASRVAFTRRLSSISVWLLVLLALCSLQRALIA